ncbi:MAG: family 16 glycoside hydrolase [Planctomycetota bacterium]|nr:family 16 glycoside hydrolase [Planctomycetota bacterium]
MVRTIMCLALLPSGWCGAAFTIEAAGPGRSMLREDGRPVLVYNHGDQLAAGLPEDRTRSCYVHPLFGLDGEVLTDDFPSDHPHHRGVAMMWPRIRIGTDAVDQWHLRGIRTINETLELSPADGVAVLTATNSWVMADGAIVARESTVWRVHPADARGRAIDIRATITAGERPVTLQGAASPKGYGGHLIRLAPRTNERITTDRGAVDADLDRRPFRWADYSAAFENAPGPSGVTLMPHPAGDDYPPAWQLRPYGVLGIAWPGIASRTISSGESLTLEYRMWIHRGHADTAAPEKAWSTWMDELGRSVPTGNRFDPLTTDAWSTVGTARYSIEDGVLHGRGDEPRNSFHVFPRSLGDFELEMEFMPAPGSNSGVQVRSEVTADGKAVRGYQIEIDTSDRAWTGGLYDELRRGWLETLADDATARSAFIPERWNHLRIIMEGPRIRTWVNGVPCVDAYDATDLEGVVALQVHGGACDVRWRNLALTPLGRHRWHPVFDGASLKGWDASGGGRWSIEDGVLVGRRSADGGPDGRLMLNRPLGDFTARLEFMTARGTAGVRFREQSGASGPEAILNHGPDDWHTMTITAAGSRIVVHVDGSKTMDATEESLPPTGRFGLRLHGDDDAELRIRSLEILRPDDGTRTADGLPAPKR